MPVEHGHLFVFQCALLSDQAAVARGKAAVASGAGADGIDADNCSGFRRRCFKVRADVVADEALRWMDWIVRRRGRDVHTEMKRCRATSTVFDWPDAGVRVVGVTDVANDRDEGRGDGEVDAQRSYDWLEGEL